LSTLNGKVAIVTGGARGIGRAAAVELARQGAAIAIADLQKIGGPDSTSAEIAALGGKAITFQLDVGDRPAVERMMSETVETFGRIDILVNNAGLNIRKPLVDLEVSDVEKVWSVILWGTFHCSQLAARQMLAQGQGGNIVIISSVHGSRPYPNSTAYNGAKAAVNHMAATWAAELAKDGIRVNSIEPGWIDTPGERAFATEEEIRAGGSKVPLKRLGQPEEVARAVRFLVTDAGSYLTGSCLRVDGGYALAH
jgi:glucose 1-dehydrogenase